MGKESEGKVCARKRMLHGRDGLVDFGLRRGNDFGPALWFGCGGFSGWGKAFGYRLSASLRLWRDVGSWSGDVIASIVRDANGPPPQKSVPCVVEIGLDKAPWSVGAGGARCMMFEDVVGGRRSRPSWRQFCAMNNFFRDELWSRASGVVGLLRRICWIAGRGGILERIFAHDSANLWKSVFTPARTAGHGALSVGKRFFETHCQLGSGCIVRGMRALHFFHIASHRDRHAGLGRAWRSRRGISDGKMISVPHFGLGVGVSVVGETGLRIGYRRHFGCEGMSGYGGLLFLSPHFTISCVTSCYEKARGHLV